MQKIYNSVTEMVGRTPLVNLSRLAKKFKVKANILAKCEFYNPVFSVKDRVALKMIEKAEEAVWSGKTRFLSKQLREIRVSDWRPSARPEDINW